MPKFTVTKHFDAWVPYYTEVEADTPEEARDTATAYDFEGKWKESTVIEFDDVFVTVDDEAGNRLLEGDG